jgi:hypothetical protein
MRSPKIATVCLFILFFAGESVARPLAEPDSTAIDSSFWNRRTLSIAATGTLVGGIFIYGWAVWWVNDYRSFRFYTDPGGFFETAVGMDKVGHMFTGYYIHHVTNDILTWGGHDKDAAFWWATGISAFHAFMVEVGDGFTIYGFDPEDMLSNWTGVAYSVLQHKVPFLSNFEIKWSLFYPLNRHAFKINSLYDYHIYWLSARVNDLLPKSLEPLWPDWLQIAAGYSSADNFTRREFVLGFDFDLEQIPIEGRDINLLKRLLNLFHVPAPGVKFSPGRSPEFHLLLLN